MNSINGIVRTNAINVARQKSKDTGKPAYVYKDEFGRMQVTQDEAVYEANKPVYACNVNGDGTPPDVA